MMVMTATSHTASKLTLDQFLHLPETEPASEYWNGEVVQKAMPTGEHGIIQRLLSAAFTLFLREHPIADGGPEIRCNFRGNPQHYSPIPDFLIVRRERLPRGQLRGHLEGAPDIAIEILSPDDPMTRVMAKIRFYLANGVQLVWLINPYDRTVTAWSGQDLTTAHILTEGDILDTGDILPGFRVLVRDILPPPDDEDEGNMILG